MVFPAGSYFFTGYSAIVAVDAKRACIDAGAVFIRADMGFCGDIAEAAAIGFGRSYTALHRCRSDKGQNRCNTGAVLTGRLVWVVIRENLYTG